MLALVHAKRELEGPKNLRKDVSARVVLVQRAGRREGVPMLNKFMDGGYAETGWLWHDNHDRKSKVYND
jgi:hypothetical protein